MVKEESEQKTPKKGGFLTRIRNTFVTGFNRAAGRPIWHYKGVKREEGSLHILLRLKKEPYYGKNIDLIDLLKRKLTELKEIEDHFTEAGKIRKKIEESYKKLGPYTSLEIAKKEWTLAKYGYPGGFKFKGLEKVSEEDDEGIKAALTDDIMRKQLTETKHITINGVDYAFPLPRSWSFTYPDSQMQQISFFGRDKIDFYKQEYKRIITEICEDMKKKLRDKGVGISINDEALEQAKGALDGGEISQKAEAIWRARGGGTSTLEQETEDKLRAINELAEEKIIGKEGAEERKKIRRRLRKKEILERAREIWERRGGQSTLEQEVNDRIQAENELIEEILVKEGRSGSVDTHIEIANEALLNITEEVMTEISKIEGEHYKFLKSDREPVLNSLTEYVDALKKKMPKHVRYKHTYKVIRRLPSEEETWRRVKEGLKGLESSADPTGGGKRPLAALIKGLESMEESAKKFSQQRKEELSREVRAQLNALAQSNDVKDEDKTVITRLKEEIDKQERLKGILRKHVPPLSDPIEKGLGLDENGRELEVAEDGRILLDVFSQRPVRVLPHEYHNDLVTDLDPLEVANYIHNEWDSYRDDLRDGRYHPDSLTVLDYTMAITKGVKGQKEWKHKRESTQRLLADRMYQMRFSDGKEDAVRAREATNLNPAFDKRALAAAFDYGTKWEHLGRKHYYDIAADIPGDAREDMKDPIITTRGLSLYIINRVMSEMKFYDDIHEALLEIGREAGYDYGPRRFGKAFCADPFNIDLSAVNTSHPSYEEAEKQGDIE